MDFTVVVPVYNNSSTLDKIHLNISSCFAKFNYNYQILFINDGSQDGSMQTLLRLKQHDNHISVIDLDRNYGQSIALFAGYEHAKSSHIITLSADLQEESGIIEKYIRALEQFPDADFVFGQRAQNEDYWIFRKLSYLFYKIIQIRIRQMPDGGFDSGVMTYALMQKFIANYHENIFIQAEILKLAEKVKTVSYRRLKSSAEKVQLKSIWFKIRYFIHCIGQVYFPKKNMCGRRKSVYSVRQYFQS